MNENDYRVSVLKSSDELNLHPDGTRFDTILTNKSNDTINSSIKIILPPGVCISEPWNDEYVDSDVHVENKLTTDARMVYPFEVSRMDAQVHGCMAIEVLFIINGKTVEKQKVDFHSNL